MYQILSCTHGKHPFSSFSLNPYSYAAAGAVFGVTYLTSAINLLTDETKYIRLYPIAAGQYDYSTWDNPDAMGPPSNVVSFDFD